MSTFLLFPRLSHLWTHTHRQCAITVPAQDSITASAPNPAALSYRTRPANLTVAVGEPAEFRCGVPKASPNITFTIYGVHGNYSLTCPYGHVEKIPQVSWSHSLNCLSDVFWCYDVDILCCTDSLVLFQSKVPCPSSVNTNIPPVLRAPCLDHQMQG